MSSPTHNDIPPLKYSKDFVQPTGSDTASRNHTILHNGMYVAIEALERAEIAAAALNEEKITSNIHKMIDALQTMRKYTRSKYFDPRKEEKKDVRDLPNSSVITETSKAPSRKARTKKTSK